MKHFYCFCSRSKHDKHRPRAVSHSFHFSQSTTNNDQFRVNTQDLFILQPQQAPWWSQRTEHWPAWDANNESKLKENYKQLSKRSTDSFYQSFNSLFANHLKLRSRRYMFLRKRRSFEYRHCRCLARIAIALNRCSVYGQIQYTKPPEHLCLLNKLYSWF